MSKAIPTTDHDEHPEACRWCGGPGPLEPQQVGPELTWPMCSSCRAAFKADGRMAQVKKRSKPWRLNAKEHRRG